MPKRKKAPVVDLSGGFYDYLEHELADLLGLKVMLIRDWQAPSICSYKIKNGKEYFGSTDPETQELTRATHQWLFKGGPDGENSQSPLEIASCDSLYYYLSERDPDVASDLYDEEIPALYHTGHLTLRENNALPPRTVIIHDERQKIKNDTDFLNAIFGSNHKNGWMPSTVSSGGLEIAGFVENFDIDFEDYRAAQALQNVRYALTHQFDFDNRRRGGEPFFYHFAGLSAYTRIDDSAHVQGLDEARTKFNLRQIFNHRANPIRDKDFAEKILLAGAVSDFLHPRHKPAATFARLSLAPPNPHTRERQEALQDISERSLLYTQKAIFNALLAGIDRARPQNTALNIDQNLYDPRVTIPLFREFKDQLDLPPAGRLYAETVWKGLQRYMPTLAAAPAPTLLAGHEPPRNAAAYHRKPDPRGPGPQ